MNTNDIAVVARADFEAVSRKLEAFIKELKPNEKEIMGWLMQLAGWSPSLFPFPHFHYKPRGAKMLVLGGADGLTVLFGRGGFKIIPPEGPLPTDFVGSAFVAGEKGFTQG